MWINELTTSSPDPEDPEEIQYDYNKIINMLYDQVKLQKTYCSSMQNKYRALTSTWLLAAFVGIGYILSQEHKVELPFNIFLAVILLSFLASFGITLLWFLDVVLYQKLWLGCVVELARLENTHNWLPRINLNTLRMRNSKKFTFFQSYFYIGINSVFIIISMLTAIYVFEPDFIGFCAALISSIILIYITSRLMLFYSGELEKVTIHSFR